MRGKTFIAILIAAVGLVRLSTPCAAGDRDADRVTAKTLLRDRGLRQLGTIWITAREKRLRTQLARVSEVTRRYHKAEKHLDDLLQANEKIHQGLVFHLKQLEQLKNIKPKGNAIQLQQYNAKLLQTQGIVDALRSRYVQPQRLGEVGPTGPAAGNLAMRRGSLVSLLASIRRHLGRLKDDYRPLRRDLNVDAALASVGGDQRLGPARDYLRDLKSVAELEHMLSAAALPFYRQGGRLRVSVLVNHRTPTTMTLLESGGQTLIPSSLLQAAGIDVPADAPRVVFKVGRRKLQTRRVRIDYLQIGSAVLRDVEALVLPPEGEDLGAQLAPAALSGYKVKLDAQRLRIHFEPIDDK
ncbi:MAG: aspartyl protease family protein [Planctomycetes bacterium]|nr:aspartyl protease family protein [Planctomycetota bacterium]